MNPFEHSFILASQSPRRRQLLEQLGVDFRVQPADDSVEKAVTDRGLCSNCSPEELVLESAFVKARAIAMENDTGIILSADTVAECQGEILGKPDDRDHAEKMLRLMSGKQHRVLTGVCLWHRPTDIYLAKLEQTSLRMDQLTETQLTEMLDSGGWIGKAGAFGYQDGLEWLHIEDGLESNVVGLPVERLEKWLCELHKKVKDQQ